MRDLPPVAMLAVAPNLLVVNSSIPVKSVAELVTLARTKPHSVTYSSAGVGTSGYLAAELLKANAGLDIAHVPYKSGPEAVTGVLSGNVTFMFFTLPSLLPQVEAGQLRALAIASAERSPLVPNVPTIAEAGYPGFDVIAWYGLFAPRGTPASVVARLSAEIEKALQLGDVRAEMAKLGAEPRYMSPQALTAFRGGGIAEMGTAPRRTSKPPTIDASAEALRLANYRLYAYRLRYARPVRWSDIVEEAAPFVLLRLTSDCGAEGAAGNHVKPTWCGVTARSLVAAVEDIFVPMLKSLDLSDPAKVRKALDAVPENSAAKTLMTTPAGISMRRANVGPYGKSGTARRASNCPGQSPGKNRRRWRRKPRKWSTVTAFAPSRLKAVRASEDIAGIRAIRAAVGDAMQFYVDANGAFPRQSLGLCTRGRGRRRSSLGRPMPVFARCLLPEAPARRSDTSSRRFRLHVGARCAAIFRAWCARAQHQARPFRPNPFTRNAGHRMPREAVMPSSD